MAPKHTVLIKNKQAIHKEFNKIAPRYDFATGMSHGYQKDLDYSASLLHLTGSEQVLDLCCGTGKSSKALLQHISTGKITGIDNSEGMLELARKKFQQECQEGKMEFQLQDAMQLNFPPESFDAIFMAYGLRNMPDYESCVQQLHILLKPGGRLVVHDYSLSEAWYSKIFWWTLGWFFIVPFCTLVSGSSRIFTYLIKSVFKFLQPDEVLELLSGAGFIKLKTHPHQGWRAPLLHSFYAEKLIR
jgi:ubiquinone/menaquinone biosynthesis methyltransferase